MTQTTTKIEKGYGGLKFGTATVKSESDVNNFLGDVGLDFTVDKYQERNPFTGDLINSWGSYRTDNKHIFSTGLGEGYTPFQNTDAFRAISDLAQVGEVKIVGGGIWNGGAESFVQVDLNGGLKIGGKNDEISQRVTYYNRNDGEGTARIFLTPQRLVCKNQLTLLRNETIKAEKVLRIRHTVSGEALLLTLSKEWGIIDGAFKATQEHFNLLADTKITKEHVSEILNRIAPVLDNASKKTQEANKKKQLGIAQFVSEADGGFIAWDTAWNLYNAITRYTTHNQAGFSNKEKSLLCGSARKSNFDALDLINEICGVKEVSV